MAAEQSFIEQVKEMRAIRTQQLRQMNAEQRFQASMINYQRTMIRSNEKIAGNLAALGNKITSSITGLVGAIGKTAKGAATATVGGAVSLSDSIVSGLIKVLPYAIGGLLGKILVWDNLTSDTKNRLTGSFGRLFSKLFSFVEGTFDSLMAGIMNTIEGIKKSFENLNIKFPLIEELSKKAGIAFEIIGEGLKYITTYIQDIIGFVGKNPEKAIAAALGAYLSPQILSLLGSIVAGVVATTVFKGIMTRHMTQLLGTVGGAGGAMATGRTLGEAMGARGAAQFAEKTGLSMAENVFVGEGGQAILDASGRPILRTSPAMSTGQRVTAGIRAVGSRALTMGARTLNIAGIALLAVEPSGGNITFETWEEGGGVGWINAKDSENRTKYMSNDSDPNMVALAYALRDAAQERMEANDLRPGSVLVISKRWVYRAKGINNQVSMMRMVVGTISPETVDFPDVYAERRDTYEKMVNDLKTKLIRDNEVQIAPGSDQAPGQGAISTGQSISSLAGFIQKYESGPASYNQLFLNPKTGKPFVESNKDLTKMTVGDIKKLQAEQVKLTREAGFGKSDVTGKIIGTGAIGRYQFTEGTLAALLSSMGVKDDAIFDEALQDKLFVALIGKQYQQYMDGTIDVDQFVGIVKKQWAAFRIPKAEKELRNFLVDMKKKSGIEQAVVVDEYGKVIPKSELQRERSASRIKELVNQLQGGESITDKPLITMDGANVVQTIQQKARDYYDERVKAIKEKMQENTADKLRSDLLDQMTILSNFNGLSKDGMDVPHSTIVNNNNVINQAGSGSSRGVRAENLRDREFRTITGVAFP